MVQLCLGANDKSELLPFTGINPDQPIIISGTTAAPSTGEVWAYDPTSLAIENGVSVLKPTDLLTTDPGRFIRLSVMGSPTKVFNNTPGRTLTASTGATGFQPSASSDTLVNYSTSISTSITLSGNSAGYVALEISPTNSATPANWVEIGRVSSGQSGVLAVGLSLNQTGGGQLTGVVPAGYFAKIRTVNTAGTPTYAVNGQQEVKF